MSAHYQSLLFSPAARAEQEAFGSRRAYARVDDAANQPDPLTQAEAGFITARDSFYMATVGEGGWPYVQHRGGPAGFVKVLAPDRLAFADFRGNRQYISVGNLASDPRVSLFFMDYVNRTRLKVLGRMQPVDLADDPVLAETLTDDDYGAVIERGMVIEIEAFDWNCPQHITPRYTLDDLSPTLDGLKRRIAELEQALSSSAPPTP